MRKGSLESEASKGKKRAKKVTRKNIIIMLIWLAITIFVVYQLIQLIMYTLGKRDKDKMWLYNTVNNIVGVVASNKSPSDITEEYTVKFAGLGDIYFTTNMIKGAKNDTTYDFTEGTEEISDKLKEYDLVVASLKTPIANSKLGYSTKTVYNAPQSVTELLKALNISALATATNHSLDKNEIGVEDTIANLEEAQIKQVGINAESRKAPIILNKNNINIGFLSYATSSKVKMSNKNSYLLNVFDEEELKQDIEYLKDNQVDFIVAYLHVPNEDVTMVNSTQKQNTEKLFEAGVDVVLGTGSMVVQESVEDQTSDNKKIYTIYSLGDFCGSYVTDENCLSVIANIDFSKTIIKDKDGNVKSTNTSMNINKPTAIWTVVDNTYSKTLYFLDDEIKKYDAGNSTLSSKEYKKMKEANERISTLFN